LQFLEIKLQSKEALCATTTESPINSINLGSISSIDCASLTISSLIPVNSIILYGIGRLGLTNSLKLSIISPFLILTAPISIILSFLDENPVVSKSNTT